MGSRLGDFIVQHSYRIEAGRDDELLSLLVSIEEWAHDLGVANFEVWRDADDPLHITEIHSFDSWAHYMRIAKKEPPRNMQTVYSDLDDLIVGGLDAIKTHSWEPRSIQLPS